MARKVMVVPHNPQWVEEFENEAAMLRSIFGQQVVAVYHFGSTAIPGIAAKPVIDILLTVREIASADLLTPRLALEGYNAIGEYGISGRRFYYKGSDERRSHHLHIYQFDNPHVLRHIAFRDYMRTHPISARQYGQLKEELARQFPESIDGYNAGKNQFVQQKERQALKWWEKKYKS
jgi:GrpB-like predicted nucleotidyltransferase (UPF0157 family)